MSGVDPTSEVTDAAGRTATLHSRPGGLGPALVSRADGHSGGSAPCEGAWNLFRDKSPWSHGLAEGRWLPGLQVPPLTLRGGGRHFLKTLY